MTPEAIEKFQVQHHFIGGVYAKELTMDSIMDCVTSHKHNYDHMSILATGSVEINVDGVRSIVIAPAVLNIAAGKRHSVTPLETPVKWFCIHRTDVTDPDLVDNELSAENV
jgi:hypothetical protein